MKKTLAIILSIVCLMFAVGCSEKVTDTIQERDGLAYLPNETKPFTGVYILSYLNQQKKEETHYKDGKLEGLGIVWYENGQKKSEGNVKD
ncbi:MAG: toxin-antitoxin system YwqK family antitoxin, partial [Methylococcaceae bacterium]